MTDHAIRRAAKRLRETRSFKGDDFDVVSGARSSVGHWAKGVTHRAARRLDRAIERDARRNGE